MIKFCTLFDSNYLYGGLVLYNSIVRHCPSFRLYVLCFDDITYSILQKMNLPQMTLISLPEFEDEELLKVKQDRSRGEYCWTCASSLILYVLNEYPEATSVTYLDADMMFFSSPESILKEMGNSSVLITPHRYTPRYDQSATSGIYCVQFVTFKQDKYGLETLKWWRERCLEWCYARVEDSKFGDQKYLDDWPERFQGVYVLNNSGAGTAPWNVQQYTVTRQGDKVLVNGTDVIFYHFHSFKCYTNGQYDLGMYDISKQAINLFYRPYIEALLEAKRQIREVAGDFNCGEVKKYKDWTYPFRYINKIARGYYHVIR